MSHSHPDVIDHLNQYFRLVDWGEISRKNMGEQEMAMRLAIAHDLTLSEARSCIEEARMIAEFKQEVRSYLPA